ncbi:MAG: hypothetical protein WDN00_05360 [Limisphaerales bacterium]
MGGSSFLPNIALDEFPSLVEPLLSDRFMPVRRDALWIIATKRPDMAVLPLRRSLLDNHVSMRETARQFLALAGVNDARAFYVQSVEHGADDQRLLQSAALEKPAQQRMQNFSHLILIRRSQNFVVQRCMRLEDLILKVTLRN